MKKIISIDKDAENYKKNMDELLSKKRKQMETDISSMKEKSERELDLKKKEIFALKVQQADDTVKKVNEESSEMIKKIESVFANEKDIIVNEAFMSIINFREEV